MIRYAGTVLVVLIALSAGCRYDPPIEARNDPFVPPQISLQDKKLQRATIIAAPNLSRGEGSDLLYVQVPIRNVTSRQFAVDYRIKFLDRNGLVVQETGWAHKYLAPHIQDYIAANSGNALAADFQMDLRFAK